MNTVALALVCKTPLAGQSKTRLSPPLTPDECARLSESFIRDIASSVAALEGSAGIAPYAVYAPAGSEAALQGLLPASFRLIAQRDGDLGDRMEAATAELLARGHPGVVLIGADSPTLPASVMRDAIEAVRSGDWLVIGPALDGGYVLIGMSRPRPELFRGIPWSTAAVYEATLARAREAALGVTVLPGWYDVDDEASLRMLQAELRGLPPPCAVAGVTGSDAPATSRFLAEHRATLASACP